MLTVELEADRASPRSGQGGAVLHGLFATHHDWAAGPLQAVSRLGRAIAIDRPGHGESRRPRLDWSPQAQAEQVAAGLSDLGVRRPLIIGHSFGALVALHYARAYPVAGLVLISPIIFPEFRPLEHTLFATRAMPVFGPMFAWSMTPLFDRLFLEIVHRLMFAPGAPPPAWRGTYPFDRILAPAGTVANGEDLLAVHPLLSVPQDWSDIDVPVTILSGAGDLVLDDQCQALPLAAILPRVCHRHRSGAGHMLHHSHPEAVIEAVSTLV